MEWAWDSRKAAANLANHGVLFETAVDALNDPFQLSLPDPHDDDDRWRTIARIDHRTLFIVHTIFEEDGSGRIISARLATPRERKAYEKQFH